MEMDKANLTNLQKMMQKQQVIKNLEVKVAAHNEIVEEK